MRSGDIRIPKIANDEPLRLVCQHFVDAIHERHASRSPTAPRASPSSRCSRPWQSLAEAGRPVDLTAGRDRMSRETSVPGRRRRDRRGRQVRRERRRPRGHRHRRRLVIQDNAVIGKLPRLGSQSTAKRGELPPCQIGAGAAISTGALVYAGHDHRAARIIGDIARCASAASWARASSSGRGVWSRTTSDRRLHEDPVQRVHHRLLGARGPLLHRPVREDDQRQLHGSHRGAPRSLKGATIRRGARVGGGAVLLPGVEIGEEAFVAAGALVTKDVPARKARHRRAGARLARRPGGGTPRRAVTLRAGRGDHRRGRGRPGALPVPERAEQTSLARGVRSSVRSCPTAAIVARICRR